MLMTILVVILVLILIGALPHWGYAQSYSYGYWPSGMVGLVVIILLVLLLVGRL
jgi:hypothetical protein